MKKGKQRKIGWRSRRAVWSGGLLIGMAMASAALQAQSVSFAGLQTTVVNAFTPQGIAIDRAGNVFISESQNNQVIELPANGGLQITVPAQGLNFPRGVAVDGSGNVLIADTNNNRVVKVTPDGTQTTVGSGFSYPSGVAVDGAGNTFIADTHNLRVVKVTPDGAQTTLASGFGYAASVAVDGAGNLFVADRDKNSVMKIAPGGAQTTVPVSGLNEPIGVAVDETGNIFITSVGNNEVVEVPADGGTQATIGTGFNFPEGVAVDGAGNVFVDDYRNDRVVKIQLAANFGSVNICPAGQTTPAPCSQTLALTYNVTASGTLGTPNVLTDGAPNLDFTLASGSTCTGSLTAGSSCTVNVTFTPRFAGLRRGAVQLVDSSGTVLTTTYVGGLGVGPQIAFGSGAQTTVGSELKEPASVAVDGAGDVFVADTNNNRVVKVTPGGTQTTVPTQGLFLPTSVAVDGAGNVFIADANNNRVVKVTPGGTQTTVPTQGLKWPRGVAVDGVGDVFVADTYNNRVLKVTPNGTQTMVASGLNLPQGVAVDGAGDVFVADTNNNRVVKVTPGGTQTTVPTQELNLPQGVAVDGAGDVFVADTYNNRVLKVTPNGTQTMVASGLNLPETVAVDGAGDIFIADSENSRVLQVHRSQPPALTFAATPVGSTSADSPQSFTVENIGNAPLNGSGLTVSSNFAQAPGSGTPADCTASFSLTPGESCNVSLSFTPTVSGPLTGAVTLTDNALNGHPATQTISLSGVGQANSQTLTFNPIASPQTIGTTVTLSATASSGLPVSFMSLTSSVCTVSGVTATLVNGGTCTIKSSQGGNAQYAAATPVTQSFTILKSQVITFNPIPQQTVGGSVTLHAASSPGSGIPITFSSTTPAVCSVAGNTATLLTVGTCSIQASEAGSSLYAPANPVTQSFTVARATQTITFSGLPATATYGAAGSYTLNGTASSGLPVTYAVTGPASLSGATLTITGAGTVTVTASQAGNATYAAASPVTQTVVVSAASQSITFTGLPTTATYGSAGPYSLNATASSGLPVNYSVKGPASLSGSTLTVTGAGTVVVTASQAGNTNYAAASPVSQTITVSPANQTITFTGLPGTAVYGAAGSYTLNGTASSGLPVTYSVTGPATIAGSTLTITGAGTVTVTASQAGNANYKAAAPVTQTVVVSGASQSITFGAIPPQVAGTSFSLSATASSSLPVSFTSLTTGICTVSGATVTPATPGTCAIQASQGGNAQYAAATPVTQSFTVSSAANFTITPFPGAETIKRGVLAGFVLRLNSVNGFNGSVKLTCSGGPAGSYCADLPQTVQVNGTAYAVSGILFPKDTTPGAYTITFTGISGSLTNTATAQFTVLE